VKSGIRRSRTHRPVCGYPCNNNKASPSPLILTNNSTCPGGWVEVIPTREEVNDSDELILFDFLLSRLAYSLSFLYFVVSCDVRVPCQVVTGSLFTIVINRRIYRFTFNRSIFLWFLSETATTPRPYIRPCITCSTILSIILCLLDLDLSDQLECMHETTPPRPSGRR
jgi:hypothetical protein